MESLLPSGQFILSEEDSLYNRNRQGKEGILPSVLLGFLVSFDFDRNTRNHPIDFFCLGGNILVRPSQ